MKMTVEKLFAAAAAMAVAGAGYAAADGSAVAAGPYDVVEVDSGAGAVVQTGAVRLLKGGEIHKVGAGDWSVPSGALDANGGVIGVRQGTLSLTDGGVPGARTWRSAFQGGEGVVDRCGHEVARILRR